MSRDITEGANQNHTEAQPGHRSKRNTGRWGLGFDGEELDVAAGITIQVKDGQSTFP